MKHLRRRRINENVNKTLIDEMISQLKESLTELTDDGSVLFQKDTDYKSYSNCWKCPRSRRFLL